MIRRNFGQNALLRSRIKRLDLQLKQIAFIRWRLAAQKRALEQTEAARVKQSEVHLEEREWSRHELITIAPRPAAQAYRA
jgi:hypothetical protein